MVSSKIALLRCQECTLVKIEQVSFGNVQLFTSHVNAEVGRKTALP